MRNFTRVAIALAGLGLLGVVAAVGPASAGGGRPAHGADAARPPLLAMLGAGAPTAAGEAPPRPIKPPPKPGQGGKGQIMATVNGRPIGMGLLHRILVQSYGRPVAQQLVGLELADQAARKKGLSVTEEEVDEEHTRTLLEMFRRLGSADQLEEHLDRFLAQKNMSRSLWRVIMRRNALLRKLAPKDIPVSQAELQDAFGRLHGRKVVVRHIQSATLEGAQKVKELADKGADFTALATRYSTHESSKGGGLLPPIGPSTTQLSPALRNVALAMKKIGEISNPIQAATTWHILRLEKIIEPKDVKFADVKEKIAASIREQRIRIFQNQMLRKLIAGAKIQYVDPTLKAQEEKAKAAASKTE